MSSFISGPTPSGGDQNAQNPKKNRRRNNRPRPPAAGEPTPLTAQDKTLPGSPPSKRSQEGIIAAVPPSRVVVATGYDQSCADNDEGPSKKRRQNKRRERKHGDASDVVPDVNVKDAVMVPESAPNRKAESYSHHSGRYPTSEIPLVAHAEPMKGMAIEIAPPNDDVLAAYMTSETFDTLAICPESQRAIAEVLKFRTMTHVQATCIPPIQQGLDCLAKSKTGTGKTLAFLIPAVETVYGQMRSSRGSAVSILVLSPTRELANQIAAEARSLLTFHDGAKVVVFVGGTNINSDKRAIASGATVLVATPGRLIDHIQSTPGFSAVLSAIKVLVMDEADRLLDMGFKPSIDVILRSCPPKAMRQTLLFSATIPEGVVQIARDALRPKYATIDTTGLAKDDSGSTHLHVHQELVVAPFEDFIPSIAAVLSEQMLLNRDDYKIIVFFTTARVTGFMAELFSAAGLNIVEMHSRKSQGYRTTASEKFRTGKKILMFSSDVTARGMDYPGVTFVLQVGLTDKEQYIHRLGRTARAGKEGKGMILVSPFEENFITKELRELPLHRAPLGRFSIESFRPQYEAVLDSSLRNGSFHQSAQQAYIAWLGFYNSNLKRVGFDKVTLIQMANFFASQVMRLREQPSIQKKTVGKMGLKGIPGLRLE